MSGGHFNYDDCRLDDLIDQLVHDIKKNKIDNSQVDGYEGPFSYEFPEDIVNFLKDVCLDLRRLVEILHDYDWAVSSDTSLEDFYAKVRWGDYRKDLFRKDLESRYDDDDDDDEEEIEDEEE